MSTVGSERSVQTTDATVQTYDIGNLAAVGAAIKFAFTLCGVQNDGTRGLQLQITGNAARSAVGNGIGTTISIGPLGFTDAVLVPWTTIGIPVGWAANVAFAANIVRVSWNAAAGQTVNWQLNVTERMLLGGATL